MRKSSWAAVSNRVLESIYHDPRAALLREFELLHAEIYLLAGAIRDFLSLELNGTGSEVPRDIDLAVSGIPREFFDSVLRSHGVKNRHGGYVLARHGTPPWDIWRLEESVGLRKTNTPCSIENVLRTFNLNCNAIALDIRTARLIDGGATDSVRKRRLMFVPSAIVHSRATFAAKALLSEVRLGYTVDPRLRSFVARHLSHYVLLHESLKLFPDLPLLNSAECGYVACHKHARSHEV
jgi:hypothetical protein